MSKMIDLTGRKFGKLTAIRSAGQNKCGQKLWECQCECGGIAVSASSSLLRGRTQSCGCLAHAVKDLTGKTYGKLTAVSRIQGPGKGKSRSSRWLCRCECGRETVVDANSLVTGNTASCGNCSWGVYEKVGDCVVGHFEDDATMLIDVSDYPMVSEYRWWVDKGSGYFVTGIDGRLCYLHRMLMPSQRGIVCDHINRNRLDNRRSNLRYATQKENSRNRSKGVNNTSGYIGVCWHIRMKKYVAQIKVDGKIYNLGNFETAEEAARARDKAALFFFGKFANLNFRDDENEKRDSPIGSAVHAASIAL